MQNRLLLLLTGVLQLVDAAKNVFAYDGFTLPSTSVSLTLPNVETLCNCRRMCEAKGCQAAQYTRNSPPGSNLCLLGEAGIPQHAMVPSTLDSIVLRWSDYTAYGVRFYKIYDQPGKTQGVAFLKCQNEGGQLAVLDTPEKFDEFEQAIAKFGIDKFWVSLRRDKISPNNYDEPKWNLANGTKLLDAAVAVTPGTLTCYSFSARERGHEALQNVDACSVVLAFVCQRDF